MVLALALWSNAWNKLAAVLMVDANAVLVSAIYDGSNGVRARGFGICGNVPSRQHREELCTTNAQFVLAGGEGICMYFINM